MSGSYELYAEVLRRTAVKVAGEIGWELEPSRAQFLPDSVVHWQPFREANAAMDRIEEALRGRDHLQHRRQAARRLAPAPAHRARPGRHRAAGPQLQARARPLQGGGAPARQQEGLGPHRQRVRRPTSPAAEDERAGDLGQPPRREARGPQGGHRRGQDLARRRGAARREVGARWPLARSCRQGDGRPRPRAVRGRAPASRAARRRGGAAGPAEPGRHRRAEVRDDQPAPLPQPPPRDRRCRARRSSTSSSPSSTGRSARTGTRSLRPRRGGPRRDLPALHQPPALRRASPSGCATCSARRPADLHGPRPDRPHALPLPAQRRRRIRDALARRGARRRRLRLRDRSRYAFQLEPYLEHSAPSGSRSSPSTSSARERAETMRRLFGFVGVDPSSARPSSSASGRPAAPSQAAASG